MNQSDARMLTPIFPVSLSPEDIAMPVFSCDSDRTDETGLFSFTGFFIKIRLVVLGDIQYYI